MKVKPFWLVFLLFALAFSVVVSFINAELFILKGGGYDAARFYSKGDYWLNHGSIELVFDSYFFIQLVGIYQAIGLNQFSINLISLLMLFVVYFYVFSNIPLTLESLLLAWVLILSPLAMLRAGAMIREPYFMVLLIASFFFMLRNIGSDKRSIYYSIISFFLLILAGCFHKAVFVFVPFAILLYFLFYGEGSSYFKRLFWCGFPLLLFFVIVAEFIPYSRGTGAFLSIFSGNTEIAQKVIDSKSIKDAGATYSYGASFSDMFSMTLTLIKANIYYYFYPFPWSVKDLGGFFVLIENVIRALFVVIYIRFCFVLKDKRLVFLLLLYLGFNTVWALGTSNFGTGSRHHWSSIIILALGMRYFYIERK